MAVASANMLPAIQGRSTLQQPEAVQHHRQQHEVRLAEIEHVEHEGHGDEAGQRDQPGPGLAARSRHRIGELAPVIHHATTFKSDRQT